MKRIENIHALQWALNIPRCSSTICDEIKQLSCIKTQSSTKCHCLSWWCYMHARQQLVDHLYSTRFQNKDERWLNFAFFRKWKHNSSNSHYMFTIFPRAWHQWKDNTIHEEIWIKSEVPSRPTTSLDNVEFLT